jgi:DNA-binding NtrC family response regulator
MTGGTTHDRPRGLVLTRDLLFSTKITGTARAQGFEMEVVANVDDLARRIEQKACRCVLIDLSVTGVDVAKVVDAVGKRGDGRPVIVAFGSHVDTARLNEAEAAGCDEVMPRSRFAGTLPELLGRLFRELR